MKVRGLAMSMNAIFVQVEDAEIAGFEADPDSVEALFTDQTLPTAGLLNMAAAMQERLKAVGPQTMAATLSRLPDPLRRQIEGSLRRTTEAMASGQGGDDILKLMQKHLARRADPPGGAREVLSLDKAWNWGTTQRVSPAMVRRAISARVACASSAMNCVARKSKPRRSPGSTRRECRNSASTPVGATEQRIRNG